MTKVQILNYKAGHGDAKYAEVKDDGIIKYHTTGVGDAQRYVYEFLKNDLGDVHFVVCGGDGTINEVVNGIMDAGANDRVYLSVVPTGTGNDFVRNFKEHSGKHKIDLIKYNGRYAINMLNIGFDCDVVYKTDSIKNKFIPGSLSYILGVANVLFKKLGKDFEVTYVDENYETHTYDGTCLLCAIGNGSYCGGGFNALPRAKTNDGLLEMLIVDKISRAKFITLVGAYRSGTYIDEETAEISPAFKDILHYARVRSITVKNTERICADGEIEEATQCEVSILPNAITYVV